MLFATLFNAGPLAVFDHVCKHLLIEQREPSYKDAKCYYRMKKSDGTVMKCAAGSLFDLDDYSKLLKPEGIGFTGLASTSPALNICCIDKRQFLVQLVLKLQRIHDDAAAPHNVVTRAVDIWHFNVLLMPINKVNYNDLFNRLMPSVDQARLRIWLRDLRLVATMYSDQLHDAWVLTDEAYQAVYGYAEVK